MIYPVILCGGFGTRLWPLSRRSYPKQFVPLVGNETLFQASVLRLSGDGPLAFAAPIVLTGSDFRFIVTEQLHAIGIDPGAILIEPESRNTAPAILAAALHLYKQDPEAVMLVAPSDHVVPDTEAFHCAVSKGLEAVAAGKLVTFGIAPSHAETAYGYLELVENPDGTGADSIGRHVQPSRLPRFSRPHSPRAATAPPQGDSRLARAHRPAAHRPSAQAHCRSRPRCARATTSTRARSARPSTPVAATSACSSRRPRPAPVAAGAPGCSSRCSSMS